MGILKGLLKGRLKRIVANVAESVCGRSHPAVLPNTEMDESWEMIERLTMGDVPEQSEGSRIRNTEGPSRRHVPQKLQRTVKAHPGECNAMVFVPGTGSLMTGGGDCCIKVWDTISDLNPRRFGTESLKSFSGSIRDMAVSPDGELLIAASSEGELFVWAANSGRLLHTLRGHEDRVSAAEMFDSVSHQAFSGGDDRTLKVWDLRRGSTLMTWPCKSPCTSLAASAPCCAWSGHLDGSLSVWDNRGRKGPTVDVAGPQAVSSVTVFNAGFNILTASRDNTLRVLDVRQLKAGKTPDAYTAPEFQVTTNWTRSCVSPDEKYIACGSADGSVFLWDINTKESCGRLRGHDSPVRTCAWSHQSAGSNLISGDDKGFLCQWEGA